MSKTRARPRGRGDVDRPRGDGQEGERVTHARDDAVEGVEQLGLAREEHERVGGVQRGDQELASPGGGEGLLAQLLGEGHAGCLVVWELSWVELVGRGHG
jgi:hypothetical protein